MNYCGDAGVQNCCGDAAGLFRTAAVMRQGCPCRGTFFILKHFLLIKTSSTVVLIRGIAFETPTIEDGALFSLNF